MEKLENRAPLSFERQFEDREIIQTAGGIAEVVDLRPQRLTDSVPILFAPAWACTLPVYEPALKTAVEQGRRVISLNHPRRGGEMELTSGEAEMMNEYPVEEVRKALTLRDVLRAKRVEKTDVIAHSEGALNAMLAALLGSERFRNIVLFGPAGLIGKDASLRLLKGFAAQGDPKPTLDELPVSEEDKERARAEGRVAIEYPEIPATETAKEVGARAAREAQKYMLLNPLRAFREGWGMTQEQADKLIAKLREKGIGIVIMSAVDDPVFPTERMATQLRKGSVDGFLSVRGGHGQIGETPGRYVVVANQMLNALRDKRKSTAGTSA